MTTRQQIRDALRDAGLRSGDHLVVHSSLRGIGPVDGGADAVIDAMLDALGADGTLIMPAFNYTRPLPQPYFDPAETPGKTGMLSEVFRKRPGVTRSLQPTHSVAGHGKRAAEFLVGHHQREAFGLGSPLDRVASAGGYVLLLGVTHLANSTIHVGESHARRVKFHWEEGPAPVARLRMPDGTVITHPIDTSSSCSMAFNAVEFPLRQAGVITDLTVGPALSFLMKGSAVIDAVVRMILNDPEALLCTRGNCRPCTKTREYLLDRHLTSLSDT